MRFIAKILAAAVFFTFLIPSVYAHADQVHRVKPGETLDSIAAGSGVSPDELYTPCWPTPWWTPGLDRLS